MGQICKGWIAHGFLQKKNIKNIFKKKRKTQKNTKKTETNRKTRFFYFQQPIDAQLIMCDNNNLFFFEHTCHKQASVWDHNSLQNLRLFLSDNAHHESVFAYISFLCFFVLFIVIVSDFCRNFHIFHIFSCFFFHIFSFLRF